MPRDVELAGLDLHVAVPDAELVFAGAEFDRLAEVLDTDLVAVDGDSALPCGIGVGELELHGPLASRDQEGDAEENDRRGSAGHQGKPSSAPWR